jgi:signal transduction histidine kinase
METRPSAGGEGVDWLLQPTGGLECGMVAKQATAESQLVVIASSAGGIEALSRVVASLPSDFPAPIVIAQHLDSRWPSHLAGSLARHATLPIKIVEETATLEDGVIFVVPSNRLVGIVDRKLRLRPAKPGGVAPSVDLLLETAAAAFGPGLIAVILTDSGSDGWDGAWHIKQTGDAVLSDFSRAEQDRLSSTHAVLRMERTAGVNRRLLRTNEELTALVAELRMANETMLQSSEEVQSGREEVDTRNEGFQATNQELETFNEDVAWLPLPGPDSPQQRADRGGAIRDLSERSMRLSLERLMAAAGHELKTPAAAIHIYLQLVDRHLTAGEIKEAGRYAGRALTQTRRLATLIERLLDVSRIQSGQLELLLEVVDLATVVRSAVEVAQILPKAPPIRVTVDPEPVWVRADSGRLEQVFLNLLANAVEHAGGSEAIEVTVKTSGDHAEVVVRDHGDGVAAEDIRRMFEPYTRLGQAQRTPGLGLGLYVAREIVNAHGGKIEARSRIGKGTWMSIKLPLAARRSRRSSTGARARA